jgi:hexosaminidase
LQKIKKKTGLNKTHNMRTLNITIMVIILSLLGCKSRESRLEENNYNIIPAPVSLVSMPGRFSLDKNTVIVVSPLNDETTKAAGFLASMIKKSTGVELKVKEGKRAGRNEIFMALDTTQGLGNEGYSIDVKTKKIILLAPSAAGLFHGVQSIRQLLPPQIEKTTGTEDISEMDVPRCIIKDEPRFSYRGMHLDVCRHMFPLDEIKKYIDIMALHKMNTLHWHLTDDQGWRIEIKKYPLLTTIGSMRKETLVGHADSRNEKFDSTPYGGFYTQDEAREIVKYASDRFINVIPEIEMPGHAVAAISAYPVFSCTGGHFEVETKWGVFPDVFCAGKDTTFAFLEDVLSEVMDIFPSPYIHIGGDECPKDRWNVCPACLKRMKEEKLDNAGMLQSYFVKRIEKFVASHGRHIIGWDEILEGGIAPEATVMSWRGVDGGIEAAKLGHDVIMTPGGYMYLDHYQSKEEGQPLAIGGFTPLERVYSYEPCPTDLTEEQNKHILGLQGNVWTEYISTPSYLEYMAFPRAFAIAETGWTPKLKKDFEDFLVRFKGQCPRYDLMGINYFKGNYRLPSGDLQIIY